MALAAALIASGVAPPARAAPLAARWEVPEGRSVPQGVALRYRLRVTNPEDRTITVSLSFDLHPAGHPDRRVPFDRWTGSLAAGSAVSIRGRVVPAQWFAETGRFVVEVRSGLLSSKLSFRVTRAPVPVPRFVDVTEEVGLATEHRADVVCDGYSAGAAWGDVEGDGDLDLYLPHQDAPAQLFLNDGGRFTDRAAERGVDNVGHTGIGAVFADHDNDGDQDLYVVNDGRNRLFENDGHGFFRDVAEAAGVAEDGPGSSASWGDYDGDGFLDLYVTNWARCGPGSTYQYFDDALYHNEGDGTFTDQTALLERTGTTTGAGFQAAWFDDDGDGDQDLYLANDYGGPDPKPNVLWRNDGPGPEGWRFTNVSIRSGAGLAMNSMGIAVGDYDRDLDFDLAISNIGATVLLRNRGDGTFVDVAARAGVARPRQRLTDKAITWGLAFHDLNLDGLEDLYVAGGSLSQEAHPEPQPNATFVNRGQGRFLDLSAPSGAADDGVSRGVAFADHDRDGRVDLYVVNQSGRPRLYRNVTPVGGRHWLEVDTVGRSSNRDGCGAVLVAHLPDGTRLLRGVFCGSVSLGSGGDPTVHFGLGPAPVVPRLEIRWPSGIRQVLRDVRADRLMAVREPRG